jgi:hypothetical protein
MNIAFSFVYMYFYPKSCIQCFLPFDNNVFNDVIIFKYGRDVIEIRSDFIRKPKDETHFRFRIYCQSLKLKIIRDFITFAVGTLSLTAKTQIELWS